MAVRSVLFDTLGLCEHCGVLVTVQDMPMESIDAVWKCPKCEGVLSGKTFGYEDAEGKPKKTQWIGEDGKWTQVKPTKSFDLNSWHVVIQPEHSIPIWRY